MLLVVGCLLFVESAGWVLPTFHFVIYCFPLVGCWFLVHCYSAFRYNFINCQLSTIHYQLSTPVAYL